MTVLQDNVWVRKLLAYQSLGDDASRTTSLHMLATPYLLVHRPSPLPIHRSVYAIVDCCHCRSRYCRDCWNSSRRAAYSLRPAFCGAIRAIVEGNRRAGFNMKRNPTRWVTTNAVVIATPSLFTRVPSVGIAHYAIKQQSLCGLQSCGDGRGFHRTLLVLTTPNFFYRQTTLAPNC